MAQTCCATADLHWFRCLLPLISARPSHVHGRFGPFPTSAFPGLSAYCASKAAVIGLTRATAV